MINNENLEIPFYLVLEDDDVQKGLDEVTSKIKKAGKVVENEFIKKFSDAKNQFQTIVKLGDKVYSVLGRLNSRGEVDKRTKLSFTPLENLSEAKTLLYSRKLSTYNENKEKIAIARAERARREKERQEEKERKDKEKEDERVRREEEKQSALESKKQQSTQIKQQYFDDLMDSRMLSIQGRQFSSAKEFKALGKEIAGEIEKGVKNGLDVSKGYSAMHAYDDEYNRLEGNVKNIGEIFKGALSPIQIAKLQLDYVKQAMREIQEEMLYLGEGDHLDGLRAELKDLAKQAENLEKKTKLGPLQSFLNRFKSYGMLRIVRNFFSSMEQGLRDSIKNIAKFSPQMNQTMSSVTSQLTILSNSLATVVVPLLKIVEPILKGITKLIANIATGISYLIAKLTRSATYLKVNTDYLKDFSDEMNQFSFDKFEALSNSDNSSSMFIEANTADGISDSISDILAILLSISSVIAVIGASKLITWIKDKSPDFFKGLKDSLTNTKTKLVDIGSSLAFVYAIYQLVTEIKDLVDNWDSKSLQDQIKGIIKVTLYGLGAILIAVGALMSAFGRVATGTVLKIAGTSAIGITGVLDTIGVFANGGIAEQGDLFIANEKGPELVYSGQNNSSSIMNISQFKQAMVEAIYECSDVLQGGGNSPVILNLDGAEIARSKRFVSELNRKNSDLKIR